jgi:putative ABC transport system ATP-binding protein
VKDLVKVYGSGAAAVRALGGPAGVSISFAAGSFTAVMGASGSGKSTLLHCLAGLDSVTQGRVFLGDTDLTALSDRALTELRRDRVGFVFQSFNLLPALTARENILLPLDLSGLRPDRQVFDALVSSLGVAARLDHRPAQLSGGEQQRVAVARALITDPELIVADEPTGMLDSTTGQSLLAYLRACVRELGRTVVMVTHDALAAAYADRVVLLADGALVGDLAHPTPDDLLAAVRGLAR